jgi:predicted nucleic acid-binding protein
MVVIDTSSWIEALRPRGRPEVRERVAAANRDGHARLVAVVRLELWNGARDGREKEVLREICEEVPELATTQEVWDEACRLAERARTAGITVPVPDLLIVACARHHGATIESADAHFAELANL